MMNLGLNITWLLEKVVKISRKLHWLCKRLSKTDLMSCDYEYCDSNSLLEQFSDSLFQYNECRSKIQKETGINIAQFSSKLPRCLPMKTRSSMERTLVLDLDETLVHSEIIHIKNPDLAFPLTINGREIHFYVRLRPHVKHFLQEVSKNFEVVVFTASSKEYANKIIEHLDPEKKYIKHALYRDSCIYRKGKYIKDLRILGRDMRKVVMVDNKVKSYIAQPENAIQIDTWLFNREDEELLKVLKVVNGMTSCRDVRVKIYQSRYIMRDGLNVV